MGNFNKVFLMGNLTRDPETRVTPNGHTICKLGLAVNRAYTAQDGERREEVTFVDVDAFGKQAELISKYMTKGRPIFIEGRLRLDQWDDRNTGEKRSRLGVVLEGFQFLGTGGGRDDPAAPSSGYDAPPARSAQAQPRASSGSGAPKSQPARSADPGPLDDDINDDVPF